LAVILYWPFENQTKVWFSNGWSILAAISSVFRSSYSYEPTIQNPNYLKTRQINLRTLYCHLNIWQLNSRYILSKSGQK
jgi:hypothetical protein